MSLKNKYFLAFLVIFGLMLIFLFTGRVWYDDVGHWRAAKQLHDTGELSYLLDSETGESVSHSAFLTGGPIFQATGVLWMKIAGTDFWTTRWIILLQGLLLLALLALFSGMISAPEKAIWTLLLLGVNMQFLGYGTQYLGEIPMLMWLLAGFLLIFSAKEYSINWKTVLGALLVSFAVLCKEYLIVPLGLWAGLMFFYHIVKRQSKKAIIYPVITGVWMIGLSIWYLLWMDDWTGFQDFMAERFAYQDEFLAFSLRQPIRFLVLEPLIILGMIAGILRYWTRREARDLALNSFQWAYLIFFLLSSGFDRLGLALLIIPAIYLADFLHAAWNKAYKMANEGQKWAVPAFILVFLVLFSQLTFIHATKNIIDPLKNYHAQISIAEALKERNVQKVFTFDEQIIPFLSETVDYRLSRHIPASASDCQPEEITGEWLVSGEYGQTVFNECIQADAWEMIFETPGGEYQLLKRLP